MARRLALLGLAVGLLGCENARPPSAKPVTDEVADQADAAIENADPIPIEAKVIEPGIDRPSEPTPLAEDAADERPAEPAEEAAAAKPPAEPPNVESGELSAVPPEITTQPPGTPMMASAGPPAAPFEKTVDPLPLEPVIGTPELQPGMGERSFETVGPGDAIRLSFDDLDLMKVLGVDKNIPLDVTESFPSWLSGLDGRRVRLKGFMYPPLEPFGIRGFLFARDNEICCFGRDPLAYDIMPVRMAEGRDTEYIQNRPFDVVGTFHIDTIEDDLTDGILQQIYSIDDAIIIE